MNPRRAFRPRFPWVVTPDRARRTGSGSDYERVLDLAATLGLDGVRLGLEWARLEPHRDQFETSPWRATSKSFGYAKSLGLRVSVATIGEAWPAWLGLEAWLCLGSPLAWRHYVRRVVSTLGDEVSAWCSSPNETESCGAGSSRPARHPGAAVRCSTTRALQRRCERISRRPRRRSRGRTSPREAHVQYRPRPDRPCPGARLRDVTEVYVRALVKGKGPTAAARGLLVKHGGEWRVSPEHDVLDALA